MTAKCHGCGAEWASSTQCHCTGCHRQFVAVGAFDAHRRGTECDVDMRRLDGNPMLIATDGAHGPVWHHWKPEGVPNPVWEAARNARRQARVRDETASGVSE